MPAIQPDYNPIPPFSMEPLPPEASPEESLTPVSKVAFTLFEEGVLPDEISDQMRVGMVGEAAGEIIEDTFSCNGIEIAHETAVRANTVGMLVQGLSGRRAYLQERADELRHTEDELVKQIKQLQRAQRSFPDNEIIQQDLGVVTKQLSQLQASEQRVRAMLSARSSDVERAEQAKQEGGTWAGSSTYRNQVTHSATLEMAHEEYLSLLPNLRAQQVVDANGVELSRLNRSGAIHDYRHGHTNLQELRKIRGNLAGFVEKRNPSKELNRAQCKTIAQLSPGITEAMNNKDWDKTLALLDAQIAEREYILGNQAAQDLALHFEGMTVDQFKALPPEVLFGRVSLLNGNGPSKREAGWEISEPNQICDMAAIYGDLSGKDLVFDGKGPFVDDEGNIHLPQRVLDDQGKVLTKTLKPLFFNISAQLNISNTGVQQGINNKAFKELRSQVIAHTQQLRKKGQKDEADRLMEELVFIDAQLSGRVGDGFELAERTVLLMQAVGGKVSINCFSGKDRTGQLAAQVTHHHLGRVLAQMPNISHGTKRRTQGRWGHQLLRGEGIARRVVEDNTKFRALKLAVGAPNKLLKVGSPKQRMIGAAKKVKLVYNAGMTFVVKGRGQLGAGMLFPEAA